MSVLFWLALGSKSKKMITFQVNNFSWTRYFFRVNLDSLAIIVKMAVLQSTFLETRRLT
jgi:hypothetical protein